MFTIRVPIIKELTINALYGKLYLLYLTKELTETSRNSFLTKFTILEYKCIISLGGYVYINMYN